MRSATVLRSVVKLVAILAAPAGAHAATSFSATSSGAAPGFGAEGVVDGDRFSIGPGTAWKGRAEDTTWWWQIRFEAPRDIGGILQIMADHDFVLRNAPKNY